MPIGKGMRELETLRSGQQFRRVYNQGRKFSTPYFSAFILKNDGPEQRLGITVTRKIGRAVTRNRCKRRLRAIFRQRDRQLLNSVGFDLVINVRPEMINADHDQLTGALTGALERFRDFLTRSVRETVEASDGQAGVKQ